MTIFHANYTRRCMPNAWCYVLHGCTLPNCVKAHEIFRVQAVSDNVQNNQCCLVQRRMLGYRHLVLDVRWLRTFSFGDLSFAWTHFADCTIHASLSGFNWSLHSYAEIVLRWKGPPPNLVNIFIQIFIFYLIWSPLVNPADLDTASSRCSTVY